MTRWLAAVGVHVALGVLALVALTPLLWMLSASLMPSGEATAVPLRLVPSTPTLEHYRTLFARLAVGRHVMASLLVAVGTTTIAVAVNGMAGYALAKLPLPGRERLRRLFIMGLLIPGQVGMLPLFLLVRGLGLVDTFVGVMIPGLASLFGILLVEQYARAIPDAVLDAGRVDGAGEGRLFLTIGLPLCAPILATLAVFGFLGTWNDFLWPLVVLIDDTRHTLPVALASLAGEHVQDTELMMAGAVVTVVPAIVLFVALQRYYLTGIFGGGVKE